jgi:mono/diheme cytochrome c family protein
MHPKRISIAFLIVGAVLLNAPGLAQWLGDAKHGSVLVLSTCSACHGVRKGERSANPLAPSFTTIAQVKDLSEKAISVALQSPPHAMPKIKLDPQQRADVVAYILSLKDRPK